MAMRDREREERLRDALRLATRHHEKQEIAEAIDKTTAWLWAFLEREKGTTEATAEKAEPWLRQKGYLDETPKVGAGKPFRLTLAAELAALAEQMTSNTFSSFQRQQIWRSAIKRYVDTLDVCVAALEND